MRKLMPHLQSSVATHRKLYRLESLAAGALAALDSLRPGVILCCCTDIPAGGIL